MRISNYKLLNEMCTTFSEALEVLEDVGVRENCLLFMDAIKTNISQHKDSLKTNALLDVIDEIVIALSANNSALDIEPLSKELIDRCKNDINYEVRVLFVAELGGKWDSMKSVYESFIQRTDCKVDVVLQPIFRVVQTQDGKTQSNVIYEDYLTPLGINHIPYEEYDFSRIRPDITFFCQPYESVTLPMFWPENMSKYTRLVYLPYYTAVTMRPGSVTHASFFQLNTQKYSWRIACQSAHMKELYRQYAACRGNNVVVTGLPKWDYVTGLTKDKVPCPKEWVKKLLNRKVFLLNFHFTKWSYVEYIKENIISLFASRDDIALIWRPHPMLETIMRLYETSRLGEYYEFINYINNSNNMLIDTNMSYAPSFVWSDALLTTFSSIGDQYLHTRKPLTMFFPEDHFLETNNGLFDHTKLLLSYSKSEIEQFVANVCAGIDDNLPQRESLLETYFKLSDGKCGERVAQIIMSDLLEEKS